jgi:type I restriction enzyme R subunit
MKKAVSDLQSIYKRAHALNNKDRLLSDKYENDVKFAIIHKRIRESHIKDLNSETILHTILLNIKHRTDLQIINNEDILRNQDYFLAESKRTILEALEQSGIRNLDTARFISSTLVNEYVSERGR